MPDFKFTGTLQINSDDPNTPREIGLEALQSTFFTPVAFASYEGVASIHGITELGDLTDPPRKYRQQVAAEAQFRRRELAAAPDVVANVSYNPYLYTGVNLADAVYSQIGIAQEHGNPGGQFNVASYTAIPVGLPWWMNLLGTGSSGTSNQDSLSDEPFPAGYGYTAGTWTKLPFTAGKTWKTLHPPEGFNLFTNEDPESPKMYFRSGPIGSTTNPQGRTNLSVTAERGAGAWDDGWNIYVHWQMSNPPVGSGPVSTWYIQARRGNQSVVCDITGARLGSLQAGPGSGADHFYRRFGLPSDTSFRFYGIVAGELHDHQFPQDLTEYEANLDDDTLDAGGLSPWFYLDRSYPVGALLRQQEYKEILVNEDPLVDALIADGGTVAATDQWSKTTGYSGGVTAESHDPIEFTGKTVRASFTMTGLTPLQVYTVKLTYEQRLIGSVNSVFLEDSIDVYPGLATSKLVEIDVIAPSGFERRLYGTNVTGFIPEVIGDGVDVINNLLWEYEAGEAGATYTATELAAIAAFQNELVTKPYKQNVKYVLPFFGNDLVSSLLPCWDFNFLGPPANTGFVDADCSSAGGLKGNGSSKILTLPFKYSELSGSVNSFGMGVWFNDWDVSGTAGGNIGSMWNAAPTQVYGVAVSGANIDFQAGNFANVARLAGTGVDNTSYYGQKFSDTSRKIFRTGLLLNENTTNDTSTDMGYAVPFLFGDNLGGTRYNASSLHVAYYTDGTLSDANVLDLHNLIETYLITAVGR